MKVKSIIFATIMAVVSFSVHAESLLEVENKLRNQNIEALENHIYGKEDFIESVPFTPAGRREANSLLRKAKVYLRKLKEVPKDREGDLFAVGITSQITTVLGSINQTIITAFMHDAIKLMRECK